MTQPIKFWIPGPLPGLNEIILVSKKHWSEYARMKRQWTDHVKYILGPQQTIDRLTSVITWIERDKRRDPDNIAAGKKFILDGMVKSGMIKNDGWKQIAGWKEDFEVDKKKPGVLVEIIKQGFGTKNI